MSLDLSDNPLTGEMSEALAGALRGQDGLRALNLNDTSLGDEGIRSVAEVCHFAHCCSAVHRAVPRSPRDSLQSSRMAQLHVSFRGPPFIWLVETPALRDCRAAALCATKAHSLLTRVGHTLNCVLGSTSGSAWHRWCSFHVLQRSARRSLQAG